jgi:phage shock protein C
MEKRLYRSRSQRVIFGVCGGLAEYFGIDPVIVRVIAVLSIFISGLGILGYIIMAVVVPLESSQGTTPQEVVRENVEEMKERAGELGREIQSAMGREGDKSEAEKKTHHYRRNIFGIILIVLGILFLLASLDLFWWLAWRYVWPLILVAIGALIIFGTRRR